MNLDAGEQFNTIADRREIQEQKMKMLNEKKKIKQAQRLVQKKPLNPSTEKKVNKMLSGEKETGNQNIRDIIKDVVTNIVKEEFEP